jgi:CheY-like chemotaxis protein
VLTASLLRGVHIVVIDDDDEARDLLQAVLAYCGAEVITANSARGGLDALGRIRPDVIVCDVVMPGDDGYALVRALQTLSAVRDVPIIALTAHGVGDADGGFAAGFAAYLKKPIEPWALCRTILEVAGAAPPS